MNTDNLKQICDEALKKLATALEAGHSDALKTYLSTMSRFHRYSWLCQSQHSQDYVHRLTM
jgi:hypothetical protein